MSMSGDELRVPLRIDTSQIESDLRAVDKELARLEQRVIRTFNRTVANAGTGQATKLSDVRAFLGQSGPLAAATLGASPELARALRSLEQREQAIARQAAAGRTSLPATERQEALGRLRQVERGGGSSSGGRPTEITARAEFFDKMRQSLLRGTSQAASLAAAQTGIPGASRLAGTLMGLIESNPILAGLVGGGAALGGGALAVASAQAGFQRQQAALASSLVGGPAFGTTRTLEGLAVMAAGQGIDTSNTEAQALAKGLASSGMSRSQLLGNLSNVLMTAKPAGMQSGEVAPLVGALATGGGMSAAQINATLQDLQVLAGTGLNGSLQQLLQGMKTLSSGAVGAARDVYSLAAIQRAVGPSSGIAAGALMQGVMGATGGQALQTAGLLGMTPQAFMAAQSTPGGMAQIYDRIAAFARRLPPGAAGTLVAEQLLGQTGLLNMQGLSPTQQAGFIQGLRTAPQGQASAWAQRYLTQARQQRVSPAASYRRAAARTDQITPPQDLLWIAAQNAVTQGINQPGNDGRAALAARSAALGMTGPVPTMPLPAAGESTSAGPSVRHDLNIKVTVQDQRGKELTRKVDHTRVVTGAKHHGHAAAGHPQAQH